VRRWGLFLLAMLAMSLTIDRPVTACGPGDGHIVKIPFASTGALADLAAQLDVWEVHRDPHSSDSGYIVAYISATDATRLTASGITFEVSPLDAALPETIPGFPCYRTVDEIYAQLNQWAQTYPDLTQLLTIGQSYEGRPLQVMRLTNENGATGMSPKPIFFLMANIHGRELITPETALAFMQFLLENYGLDPDVTWLLDEHIIYVLTSANPDGHIRNEAGQPWAYWRKNTHPYGSCPPDSYGVDLNRNSSFHWGGPGASSNSCSDIYRGPFAISESETMKLQSFLADIFPDQRGPNDADPAPDDATGVFITLHSYSNLVLWPWGDTYTPAPNAAQLQMLGRRLASFNDYTPQQASGLYLTSGTTDDWVYGELGVAAYTFEIGSYSDGFYPSCSRYNALIQPNIAALLYAAKVARTPYITAFGPHTQNVVVTPTHALIGQPITVQATLDDGDSVNAGQTIVTAEAYLGMPPWDGGLPTSLFPVDGAFDESREAVQGQVTTAGLPRGRHLVYVRGQDADGLWGPVSAAFVELWDSGLTLSPSLSRRSGPPGATVSHHLTMTNTGMLSTTATLTATTSAWAVQIVPTQTIVPAGSAVPITVAVAIPASGTLLLAAPNVFTVTARSLGTMAVQAQAVLITTLRTTETNIYLPLVLRIL